MRILDRRFLLLATSMLAATPLQAQEAGADDTGTIIVTARRVEEKLQDVPISITVLSQESLAKRNIFSAADLGAYVPSLSTNSQFGPEKSSFVIRGFTQEGKTSPSVGVYFADVVAPRSFGGTTSGNGAGIGSLFDLQNVQVLKGPQGTLFGRNTTGGAILLVPQKPTAKLEGYVEGSLGNYDMHRVQAVLNVPLSDSVRIRAGIDWHERDGYLKNKSGLGPSDFHNVNYVAARLSVVADLTSNLENYTIGSYSKSDTNGDTPKLASCTLPATVGGAPIGLAAPLAAALNPFACAQVARSAARGDGFWTVENSNPDPYLKIEQWQVINTTTWQASDNLTVKNIISYAQYREKASFSLFGDNYLFPAGPLAGQLFTRTIELHPGTSGYNSQQSTFTEEFQLQGTALNDRLTWQAGAYFELSKPLGFNTGLTGIFLNCTDTAKFICTNPLGFGTISGSNVKDTFNNKGLYAQGTYKLTDKLNLTGGIRYTIDQMTDIAQNLNILVPTSGTGVPFCQNLVQFHGATPTTPLFISSPSQCETSTKRTWKKPTWLLELDYKPMDDLMVYAKWARGYRQGSINSNNIGFEVVGPESVDTYEIGAKTSFHGAMPGYFNIAAFYNNFRDQQIAVNPVIAAAYNGIIPQSQPIVNAGKSRIWGIEVDASVRLFPGFTLDAAYAYLDTKLQSITPPPLPIYYSAVFASATPGDPLALSPKNRVTLTGTYVLPLDESVGKVSLGATFTHTDANRAVSPSVSQAFFMLKESNLVNVNVNWRNVLGKPVDLSFFMTNVTNEKRFVYPATSLLTIGGEGGHVNQPRIFGFSLRYHFGN
jgi:iron complex outermembrane receptor protein